MATQDEFDAHFKKLSKEKETNKEKVGEEMQRRKELSEAFTKYARDVIIPAFQEKQEALRKHGIHVHIVSGNIAVPNMPSVAVLTSRAKITLPKQTDLQNNWKKNRDAVFYALEVDANGIHARIRIASGGTISEAVITFDELQDNFEKDLNDFFINAYPEK